MDSTLRRNVERQLRPEDTGDQMVAVAERYDATMYRTGGYKGSNRSHASGSKPHIPKNENTNRKPSITSMYRNTGKEKSPAKKRTYTKSHKPSKAVMSPARQKEPVSTVAKAETWQMNGQRKM